jgi:hypothetical protein
MIVNYRAVVIRNGKISYMRKLRIIRLLSSSNLISMSIRISQMTNIIRNLMTSSKDRVAPFRIRLKIPMTHSVLTVVISHNQILVTLRLKRIKNLLPSYHRQPYVLTNLYRIIAVVLTLLI